MDNDDIKEYIPVRMINEFVYCSRLFYLEFVEGDFLDSADTVEGRIKHRRVDIERGEFPDPDAFKEDNEKIHATSVTLSSRKHHIIAKMDLVEGENGEVFPVEYKKGSPKGDRKDIWDSDRVQIVAQGIILRENGYNSNRGIIYYAKTKERVTIDFTDDSIVWAVNMFENARNTGNLRKVPDPLIDSPKCIRCSLVSICLPDETNFLKNIQDKDDGDTIRRLYPARNDVYPVYVEEQGATVSKKGEELIIKKEGDKIGNAKLMEVSSLNLMGNIQITTQTIRELCDRNIPICYFSGGGWFNGITHGMSHKNIVLRIKQFERFQDEEWRISVSRKIIEGKIKNCRTMIRRNSVGVERKVLNRLTSLISEARDAKDEETLLGIEGTAARIYFGHFSEMIKAREGDFTFDFDGRNKRPPRDNVNAMLSYLYSILSKDFTVVSLSVGLDPYLGFFHHPKYGKPALSLDLMEEFRPIVCDSVALTLINNHEIGENHFVKRGGAVSLTSIGKKTLINAYERRLEDLVIHPLFKYSMSYRKIFEVQTRLIARLTMGEIEEYPNFITR